MHKHFCILFAKPVNQVQLGLLKVNFSDLLYNCTHWSTDQQHQITNGKIIFNHLNSLKKTLYKLTQARFNKSVFSFLDCYKHDTARICCWPQCCCGYRSNGGLAGYRHATQQSTNIACLWGSGATNLLHVAAVAQDGIQMDRPMDTVSLHRPCCVVRERCEYSILLVCVSDLAEEIGWQQQVASDSFAAAEGTVHHSTTNILVVDSTAASYHVTDCRRCCTLHWCSADL